MVLERLRQEVEGGGIADEHDDRRHRLGEALRRRQGRSSDDLRYNRNREIKPAQGSLLFSSREDPKNHRFRTAK